MSTPTSASGRDGMASAQLKDDVSQMASGKGKKGEDRVQFQLQFPPRQSDPSADLASLRDDQSNHASVTMSCLKLCQFAGHGSNSIVQDTTTVSSSSLFNDTWYVKSVSASLAALQECIHNHKDRRCRILGCKTAGILARSAYARIRHSPFLFAVRDPAVNRLEDEIGTDVPAALATVALDDEDDGVSASAMDALGIITLSSSSTPGSIVQDELLLQIQGIAFARVAPYAPTLRCVVDEDPAIPMAELQMRIQENVLSPRLFQIMERITQYTHTSYIATALPCLTACLIHQAHTTPAMLSRMDRTTFAKRWSEVDAENLVRTAVDGLVNPLLQEGCDGAAARTAALSAIRLAHAYPHASWIPNVIRWTAIVLREEISEVNMSMENKLAGMASLVVACRVLTFPERTQHLIVLAQQLAQLPPSTSAPITTCSAGLLVSWQGWKGYRRPSRMGLWTEIALSFFVDASSSADRSEYLKDFLSAVMPSFRKDEEGLSPAKDEVLLVFATVALEAGRRFRLAPDGSILSIDWQHAQVDSWLQLTWVVLTSFVQCVSTGPSLAYLDEDVTMVTAGLASYVQLLQDYLHSVGLLQPSCSATIKLTTNACPPHVLWDRMMESSALLAKFEALDRGALDSTTKLMDDMVSRELRQGIPSHHMRIFVLSLSADHWVQGRVTAIRSHFESSAGSSNTLTLNVGSGKEIISALSPKRILSKIVAAHVPPVSADGRPKRDTMKKLAVETVKMCVAAIENMALTAVEWKRRLGGSDAKQIISVAVGILQGRGDDSVSDEIMSTMIAPISEAAIARIQAQYESSSGGKQDFPMSELVMQPIKTKIKPLISSTKPSPIPKNVFQHGYWMQLCRQIITSRTRQAIYSSPLTESIIFARSRNAMRLSVPPIPQVRDARVLGNVGDPLGEAKSWINSCSAASDAAQIIAAASRRRHLRYDGEDEFQLAISVRVFNMTALDFIEGIRLEIGATLRTPSEEPTAKYFADSLHSSFEDLSIASTSLVSASSFYRHELKSGEALTWNVAFTHEVAGSCSPIEIRPSLLYQKVAVEGEETGAKLVSPDLNRDGSVVGGSTHGGSTHGGSTHGGGSTQGGESKTGEEDFQVTNDAAGKSASNESTETENMRVECDLLSLPPLSTLQPCPLVFFRDCQGDYEVFRYLWFRMPYQLAPMKLERKADTEEVDVNCADPISRKISRMSKLQWTGEAIPGGFAAKAWSFSTLSGHRLLCIFAESDSQGNNPGKQALYFRGECQTTIFSLVSSRASRDAVVQAMVPHLKPST